MATVNVNLSMRDCDREQENQALKLPDVFDL